MARELGVPLAATLSMQKSVAGGTPGPSDDKQRDGCLIDHYLVPKFGQLYASAPTLKRTYYDDARTTPKGRQTLARAAQELLMIERIEMAKYHKMPDADVV